ncbi:OLC1v1038663C2 [Oldenlandia corymbosa var. corymbosa]|uniref:myrcene synthase n=1 Tax=Oldenlandia corymbosa var. corymbosa TaxID=529605 RepID=A0AAV1D0Z0_OLDCO|nr:OLC1v1038663C2 [Oldenlandia corymbosa var. corymbosa]
MMASLMSQATFHLEFRPKIIINQSFPSSNVISSASQNSTPYFWTPLSTTTREEIPIRRSGNYPSLNWDFEYVQSLENEFTGLRYIKRRDLLKEKVRRMLDEEEVEPLYQLEMIDVLQRLGVYYHFKDQINSILSAIHKEMINDLLNRGNFVPNGKDLYATALGFKLLRQHGFPLSEEIFDRFKDEEGNFEAYHCSDMKGMLQLFEASFLSTEDDTTLESARDFTAKQLQKSIEDTRVIALDQELFLLVQHALKLPLWWRVPRVEARWFIDLYEKRSHKNDIFLELAKLDFNIVQATHQNDLKFASRWWEGTCLGSKLNFARNRLVENFFWTIGVNFEPQYSYFRIMATKVNALITTIDDVYDVYGSLDELELFTNAVERWNVEAMDDLPDYMKICYMAMHNATNEMAYDALVTQGIHIVPYLQKVWADICKTYLQEAKWYHSGYIPTLEEYIGNAWISISAPVILVHAYFFISDDTTTITKEALESLHPYHNLIRYSAMILRLADDLGTSSEELRRGDVPKSIQCYMNEKEVTEEEAREYIKLLISETWKKLNKERVGHNLPFPVQFVEVAVNLGRMAQCMYEYGDGHGHSNPQTKDRIRRLLFDHIIV